jgi:hypothetical protein
MKRILLMLSLCAAAALVFTSVPTHAATDATGSWTADVQTPDGNSMTLTFTFKQDADKLTGTVQGPQGDPMDIANGKVDGDKITFDTSFNGTTINHAGTISGDEIKLSAKSADGNFPPMDITLKRAK